MNMDSIFQIKINENKLQKILVDLNQNQLRIMDELNTSKDIIQDIKTKFDEQLKTFSTQILKQLRPLQQTIIVIQKTLQMQKNTISEAAQGYIPHFNILNDRISQSSQNYDVHRVEIEGRFNKIDETLASYKLNEELIERVFKLQSQQKNGKIDKMENLQKQLNKIGQITQILQNKNFMYFMHNLVDKEQQQCMMKVQIVKQNKTFGSESKQEKIQKYKELKKLFEETHSKLQLMQCEYTGYFTTASQGSKQAEENTHMHYAFLSSHIKEIQQRLNNYETTSVSPVNKVLYPTDKDKAKYIIDERDFKQKEKFTHLIKEEFKPLYEQIKKQQQQSDKISDKVWQISSKFQRVNNGFTQMKTDNEKFKVYVAQNQQNGQLQQILTKAGGVLNHFRSIQENLEQKLNKKVNASDFTKKYEIVTTRLDELKSQVNQRAIKQQTRKAFGFVQQKLRQMITVLAQMQNSSKKTAGSKIMMQCISCDDTVENIDPPRPPTTRQLQSRALSNFKKKHSQEGSISTDRNLRKSNSSNRCIQVS